MIDKMPTIRERMEKEGKSIDKGYILNQLLVRLNAGDKPSLDEARIIEQWHRQYVK